MVFLTLASLLLMSLALLRNWVPLVPQTATGSGRRIDSFLRPRAHSSIGWPAALLNFRNAAWADSIRVVAP